MHGIGGLAGADDGFAGVDLDPLTAMHQRRSVPLGAENLREPAAQAGSLPLEAPMLRDDLVLASLQRMIQFGHDADVVRDEAAGSQRLCRRGRQMHQHQADAAIMGDALDLRETVGGG